MSGKERTHRESEGAWERAGQRERWGQETEQGRTLTDCRGENQRLRLPLPALEDWVNLQKQILDESAEHVDSNTFLKVIQVPPRPL